MIIADCHFQAELAINTNVAVSDVRHGVTNTHTVVSNTHVIVSGLQRDVSDIRRTMVESREGTDGKNWLVIPTTDGSSISYLHLAYLESCLRRRRGSVSDARI